MPNGSESILAEIHILIDTKRIAETVLGTIGLMVACFPARRAVRLDTIESLRHVQHRRRVIVRLSLESSRF